MHENPYQPPLVKCGEPAPPRGDERVLLAGGTAATLLSLCLLLGTWLILNHYFPKVPQNALDPFGFQKAAIIACNLPFIAIAFVLAWRRYRRTKPRKLFS